MGHYCKQEGLTLVSLIITVIVLGILTTVSLKSIQGKDGMVNVAKNTYNTIEQKSSNTLIKINALKEQE